MSEWEFFGLEKFSGLLRNRPLDSILILQHVYILMHASASANVLFRCCIDWGTKSRQIILVSDYFTNTATILSSMVLKRSFDDAQGENA